MILAPLVYRRPACAQVLGISVRALDRLVKAGQFVRPIRVTQQAIGFPAKAVRAWVARQTQIEPSVDHTGT